MIRLLKEVFAFVVVLPMFIIGTAIIVIALMIDELISTHARPSRRGRK